MSNWANSNPNQIGENKDVHLMLENGIGCESYFPCADCYGSGEDLIELEGGSEDY